MWRAAVASSTRTGTWKTSLKGRELLFLLRSLSASQGEVLHPRRQGRIASGPQALELLLPCLEIPDFVVAALADEHDLARNAREVAQLGRNEQAAGGIDVHVLSEAHEEPLPEARLALEAGERHDLRADRLPGRMGIKQEAAIRMRGEYQLHRAALGKRISRSGRDRHAPLRVEIDLRRPLKHLSSHVFPLPHTVVNQLQRVKSDARQFFLVLQGVSALFSRQLWEVKVICYQM